MDYLLYFLYGAVFIWFIPRIPFLKKSGISASLLIALFLLRTLCGALTCFLSYHYFPVSDSLTFHNAGLNEYYLLTHAPREFFADFFGDFYQNNYGGFMDISHSFWNKLRTNIIVKSIGILDIITLRNFYTNTLIYNIPVFFGSVALYRVFKNYYGGNSLLLIIATFLFPSALFYTSMIHRDGLVFMSLGMIIYIMDRLLNKGFTLARLAWMLLFFILILLLRNFVSFILVPSLIAWWVSYYRPRYTALVFSTIFIFCVLLFFISKNFFAAADFPAYISDRRDAFIEISVGSNTYLPTEHLTADINGFIKAAPQAIYRAFFLPELVPKGNALLLPFALELYFVWGFFLFTLFYKRKFVRSALLYSIVFFSLINLIMIGYTIPNIGAIIRYRSVYLQLLLICLLVWFRWKSLPTQ